MLRATLAPLLRRQQHLVAAGRREASALAAAASASAGAAAVAAGSSGATARSAASSTSSALTASSPLRWRETGVQRLALGGISVATSAVSPPSMAPSAPARAKHTGRKQQPPRPPPPPPPKQTRYTAPHAGQPAEPAVADSASLPLEAEITSEPPAAPLSTATPSYESYTAAASDAASTSPPQQPSGHTVPAFLRPASEATLAAAHIPAAAGEEPHSQPFTALASAGADATAASAAAPATAAVPEEQPAAGTEAAEDPSRSSTTASEAPTEGATPAAPASAVVVVPSFLRPAPLPIFQRIKQWKYFKLWHNIGYLISVCGLLVTDILWLRSIIIIANFFGIAVHYSFTPPFWTGIYWSIFFICANLVHIGLILNERREVVLSAEEQSVYDAVFASVFSAQEYRKLLGEAQWRDLPPGEALMRQGHDIDAVHVVSAGLCTVEQERLVGPLAAEDLEARRRRGDAVRVESRMINGQMVQVQLLEPPAAGSAAAAGVLPAGAPGASLTTPLLAPSSPPSIVASLAQGLMQGGVSWAQRFRPASQLDEEQEAAAGLPATSPAEQPATSQVELGGSTPAPAPLPPSQISLVRPASAATPVSAEASPAAAATAAAASPPSPISVGVSVADTSSVPDAAILPSSSTVPADAHEAHPDSHHLLNVHVDSSADAKPLGAPTQAPVSVGPAASTSALAGGSAPAAHHAAEDATGAADEDDDEWAELDDALDEAALDKDAQLQAARKSLEQGEKDDADVLSPDDVLRRWHEERDARRLARHRERDARRAARAAAAEKKRLMGMSALERQFGQTDAKKKEVPKPLPPPAVATGTALTPGDQSVGATLTAAVADASTASDAHTQLVPASAPATAVSSGGAVPPAASSSIAVSSLPAYERHSVVVGYVRPGRLIGEMCLVSPSSSSSGSGSGAGGDYSVAPVSVTTKEATRVLSWEKSSLQRLFFRLPSLAVGWYSVVSTDLVNRLQAARASAQTSAYKHILLGVLSDGSVSLAQKDMLARYRSEHGVSGEFHTKALAELGWTEADFEHGRIHRGWLANWFRGSSGGSGAAGSGGGQPPALA